MMRLFTLILSGIFLCLVSDTCALSGVIVADLVNEGPGVWACAEPPQITLETGSCSASCARDGESISELALDEGGYTTIRCTGACLPEYSNGPVKASIRMCDVSSDAFYYGVNCDTTGKTYYDGVNSLEDKYCENCRELDGGYCERLTTKASNDAYACGNRWGGGAGWIPSPCGMEIPRDIPFIGGKTLGRVCSYDQKCVNGKCEFSKECCYWAALLDEDYDCGGVKCSPQLCVSNKEGNACECVRVVCDKVKECIDYRSEDLCRDNPCNLEGGCYYLLLGSGICRSKGFAEEYDELMASIRPASAGEYRAWLEGYVKKGGGECLCRGEPFSLWASLYFVATKDFKAVPLYGNSRLFIIVPEGINYLGGDLGESNLYYMDGFNRAGSEFMSFAEFEGLCC